MQFQLRSCNDPEQIYEDSFPTSDQIWGMIGTIAVTVACWILYTQVKFYKNYFRAPHPVQKSKAQATR
ncbi:unnamed protein product [Arctia plantaginis]|uniref:Uncharacterized protein n=1 Tax=Arctia plantaginis TaxID=874455 RepID=A0A8S0ZXV5_ARCPL|nr:unnamed protein product [Arctia plantaginis]CAB3248436.1 unnamed protein product [Arctia plantaginis]